MIAADTSVVVAAALPWHEAHAAARSALPRSEARLLAQVAVETYSVLTRLPPPQRVSPSLALDFLKATFAFPPVALSPAGLQQLLELAVTRNISGGAVYDALIGATAKQEGMTLLTLDQRAVAIYQLLGVDFRLVG